jgi:cell division protein FtsB
MGAPAGVDVEALRAEVEQLKTDKARLEAQLKEMSQVGNA